MAGEADTSRLDAEIRERVATGKGYFLLLLTRGPRYDAPDHPPDLQMQHLRHLFTLRASGVALLTGPVTDDGNLVGIGIFAAESREAVEEMMREDPGVRVGRFGFEVHPMFGLPGDTLT